MLNGTRIKAVLEKNMVALIILIAVKCRELNKNETGQELLMEWMGMEKDGKRMNY